MSYTEPLYLFVFLPLALICYQAFPAKWRGKVLIVFSYFFFYSISKKLLIYLIATTLVTHHIGIWIDNLKAQEKDKTREEKKNLKAREKKVLILGIFIMLATLYYFKYWNFTIWNMNRVASFFSFHRNWMEHSILMPIGISFYTLQAIGYMADVYWGRVKADENLEKTALFLSFFPQIMEGPIARYTDIQDTMFKHESLTMPNLREGFIRIFWGLFKKLVIADRASIAVGIIFNNYAQYNGAMILVGAVAYTVQLYMEFSGCMDIVIGSGKMFGIVLPENFRQPFFAISASEFWKRWHITLGAWFKNYIFYPVSTSKLIRDWNHFGKKHFGKYVVKMGTVAIALFPVWLSNGIWHGARWGYIFYGMYYFIIIMFEISTEPLRDLFAKALHINIKSWGYRLFQTLKLWIIVVIGEMFFRAGGFHTGLHMFKSIFQNFSLSQISNVSLLKLGLDGADYLVIFLGVIIVFAVDLLKENGYSGIKMICSRSYPERCFILLVMIVTVVVFGAYGEGYQAVDLIYAGF